MSDQVWKERFDELCHVLKQTIPGFEIRYKADSFPWKDLPDKIARIDLFWDEDAATTVGSTIWFPRREYVEKSPRAAFYTLAHEAVHAFDFAKAKVGFGIGYLSPQVFALVFIVAAIIVGACGSLFWILPAVLALVAVAPLPSPWRADAEARAYAMGFAIDHWTGREEEDRRGYVIGAMTSFLYWKMVWGRHRAARRIDRYVSRIAGDRILSVSPAYRLVKEIVTTE